MRISDFSVQWEGGIGRELSLSRILPDPSPSDLMSRYVRNTFKVCYEFDRDGRIETSVDIPLLRTALLSLADTAFQNRIISGEK